MDTESTSHTLGGGDNALVLAAWRRSLLLDAHAGSMHQGVLKLLLCIYGLDIKIFGDGMPELIS
jgi:hypothetical protein